MKIAVKHKWVHRAKGEYKDRFIAKAPGVTSSSKQMREEGFMREINQQRETSFEHQTTTIGATTKNCQCWSFPQPLTFSFSLAQSLTFSLNISFLFPYSHARLLTFKLDTLLNKNFPNHKRDPHREPPTIFFFYPSPLFIYRINVFFLSLL